MRMNTVERYLVNRSAKGTANVARIARILGSLAGHDMTSALELGCGIGDVAAFLSRQAGMTVGGIDVDPHQIALAHERFSEHERLEFRVADACHLPFEACRFDLVVAQNVFHHLPCWRRATGEIARVLRPGGYLFWLDLTPPAPLRALLRAVASRFGVYTLHEIRTAFRDAGLGEVALRQSVRWIPIRHELILRRARQ